MHKAPLPNTPSIHDALKSFDFLPDSGFIREPVVRALFCCSASTIWRNVKKGTLPAPRMLSERIKAWNVGEIRKALAQRSIHE